MGQLICWLATYGVVFTIADATILSRPRGWVIRRDWVGSQFVYDLLGCYFCLGFHASVAMGLLRFWGLPVIDLIGRVGEGAFAGATFCYLLNALILDLEASDDRHPATH